MLHNIPGNRDCAIRNTCVRLFENYKGDELQRKIAEHTADEWVHLYKYKVFKGVEPAVAVRYRKMRQEERDAFDKNNKDWNESEEMLEWARGEYKVLQENGSNLNFLTEMLGHLEEKDIVRRGKIKEVLATHGSPTVRMVKPRADWVD